jgi:hypothetical protein
MLTIDPICLIDDDNRTIFRGKEATGLGSAAQPQEIIMSIRRTLIAGILTLAVLGSAHADSARPIEARSVDLGEMYGVAYYTVEREGFRVVTTLAQGEAGTPLRVVTVLAPGQSVVLSTPREAGVLPVAVEISRQADTLLIRKAEAATH